MDTFNFNGFTKKDEETFYSLRRVEVSKEDYCNELQHRIKQQEIRIAREEDRHELRMKHYTSRFQKRLGEMKSELRARRNKLRQIVES